MTSVRPRLTVNNGGSLSGAIVGGSGGVTLTSGTLSLTGGASNTYTGLTTVNAGAVLTLGKSTGFTGIGGDLSAAGTVNLQTASGQLPSTCNVTLTGSGKLDLSSLASYTQMIASLNSASGTSVLAMGTSTALTISNTGTAGTYVGTITQTSNSSLTVSGGGTGVFTLGTASIPIKVIVNSATARQ